jgi:hypothetical protein
LREAEETQSTLQAECDQYRTILAETVRSEDRLRYTLAGLFKGLLGRRAIGPIE